MSKFCPMCNAVTNCTDNCNSCMEEESTKNKIYYIKTSDNEWSSSIKGYYSTLEKAKENMCHFSDWYRANGTGKIYELTLDEPLMYNKNPVLVYRV